MRPSVSPSIVFSPLRLYGRYARLRDDEITDIELRRATAGWHGGHVYIRWLLRDRRWCRCHYRHIRGLLLRNRQGRGLWCLWHRSRRCYLYERGLCHLLYLIGLLHELSQVGKDRLVDIEQDIMHACKELALIRLEHGWCMRHQKDEEGSSSSTQDNGNIDRVPTCVEVVQPGCDACHESRCEQTPHDMKEHAGCL